MVNFKHAHKWPEKGQEPVHPRSSPLTSLRSPLQASSSAGLRLSETCSRSSNQNTDAQRLCSGNTASFTAHPGPPGKQAMVSLPPQGLGLETGFCLSEPCRLGCKSRSSSVEGGVGGQLERVPPTAWCTPASHHPCPSETMGVRLEVLMMFPLHLAA